MLLKKILNVLPLHLFHLVCLQHQLLQEVPVKHGDWAHNLSFLKYYEWKNSESAISTVLMSSKC